MVILGCGPVMWSWFLVVGCGLGCWLRVLGSWLWQRIVGYVAEENGLRSRLWCCYVVLVPDCGLGFWMWPCFLVGLGSCGVVLVWFLVVVLVWFLVAVLVVGCSLGPGLRLCLHLQSSSYSLVYVFNFSLRHILCVSFCGDPT